jgi:hypothetical protein
MNETLICTCSGDRGNDLFPILNIISGMVGILSQFINDCPTGLGSFSHSFLHKEVENRLKKVC